MINDMNRFKYPLNLQLFAEDPAEPEPNPEPTKPTEPQPEPKLVPQDEVDRIVADRLARERKKYADYDDIKAKLAEIEGGQTTLTAEKEAAEKRAQEAEDLRNKALDTANRRLIKAEFKAVATTGEVRIRPDALEDAFKLADISGVTVDDDGNVSGMADVVKTLVESKPFLGDQQVVSRQVGGDTNGGSRKADTTGMTPRELMALGYSSAKK